MSAFLAPLPAQFHTSGRFVPQISSRRTPLRTPPHVRFSATTDEAPPLDGPPTPVPPPSRPEPKAPPQRPAAFSPSRPTRPSRPHAPRSFDRRDDRGERRPYRGERVGDRGERGADRPPFVPDPKATYYTSCGNCKAAYVLKPEVLAPRGKKVGCAVCGNEWFQRMDRLSVLKETEGMKPYPMEKKDKLIEAQARQTEERRARRDSGERRDGRSPREGGRRDRYSRVGDSQHSLFIGNLPFSFTQERLEEMIGAVVKYDRISLVTDSNSRSKGFAFADLQSAEDVQKAISQLDGTSVGGRPLSVKAGRKN